MDQQQKSSVAATKDRIRELSAFNKQMRSKQLRKEIFQKFEAKKDLSKYSKYLTKKDIMADLTLQISKERHTKHLKRDEVSAITFDLQDKAQSGRTAFVDKKRDRSSIVENFSGDPMMSAFEKR